RARAVAGGAFMAGGGRGGVAGEGQAIPRRTEASAAAANRRARAAACAGWPRRAAWRAKRARAAGIRGLAGRFTPGGGGVGRRPDPRRPATRRRAPAVAVSPDRVASVSARVPARGALAGADPEVGPGGEVLAEREGGVGGGAERADAGVVGEGG